MFFGPMLLPKAISFYRSLRAGSSAAGLAIQPLPPKAFRALLLLACTALVFALRALVPYLAPENIFLRTQSRLQIPTDVLFNRVSSLRAGGALSAADAALKAKFVNLESRLLYLQFGPAVLAECPFCTSDDPRSYFYYALPALLVPHLLNLVVVSLATSDLVAGKHGPPWRATAAITAFLGAAADVYLLSSYNHQLNSRATRLADLDPFFWHARVARYLGLAALDAALAGLLYLSSTHRAFAAGPDAAARVEAANRALQAAKSRLSAVGIVKNTAARDEELRARAQAYWAHEVRLMREVMEDREVLEGVNDALQNRISIEGIAKDADMYAMNVLPRLEEATVPETTVG